MMIRRIYQLLLVTFSVLIVSFSALKAQYIQINEDPGIHELIEKYMIWEKEETQVSGWRIQIINTDDRRIMETALRNFRYEFPNVNYVNWKQISPYYKVIIGAYETKLDVLAFLQKIKVHFPSAIPVIDKIDKRELLDL